MKYFLVFISALFIGQHVFAEAEDLVALEHFAALPQFSKPVLSPDGERVASTISYQGHPLLVVQPINSEDDEVKEKMIPINAGKNFFNWYAWGNDERLVFNIRGTTKMFGHLWNVGRMGSIGRDGKDGIQFEMTPNQMGLYRQSAEIIDFLDHDTDHILAALDDTDNDWAAPEVHLVNINTGLRKRVVKNRAGIQHWIADASGVVRVGVKVDTEQNHQGVTIYYRDKEGADWEKLQKVNYFSHDRMLPARFDENDENILLVSSSNLDAGLEEDDEAELFRYDLTARKILGPFQDSHRDSVMAIVRHALPNKKIEIVSHNRDKTRYTFRGYSDIQAPKYYFLDLNDKSLKIMGAEYPGLDNAVLSPMEIVSYQARDKLDIPAFLTIPKGQERKNLPFIIYPHGGPWAHDSWGFDNYVQFFASRGYAVFQPQFRGSTSYGINHQEAGYGQWGYAIQDDITDGVNWLIEQGIADPDRICIVGASFGGYAAAMGAAKTPELYRCAISINGVLDFKAFLGSHRRLLFSSINRAVTKGDGNVERASPYHMAKHITAPMLLIASERDTVVPVDHSIDMYRKLKRLKKRVEYVELPNGEHWRSNEANEIKALSAMEQFLEQHLAVP